MACEISIAEEPTQAQSTYIPRNALDHMNPFFFKGHSHASHQHQHRHHHPHHHSHRSKYPDTHAGDFLQTPVPRRLSIQQETNSGTVSVAATASTTAGTLPVAAAASSAPSATYNTPPATPPLVQSKPATLSDAVAWCTARARIPTPDGSEYFLHIYENVKDKKEHLAFVFGDAIRSKSLDDVQPNETELDRVKRGAYVGRLRNSVAQEQDQLQQDGSSVAYSTTATSTTTMTEATRQTPLVRIHSECFTGEIGHSARCDCGEQLDEAIRRMKAEGAGVVVYLRQEGRGIGLGEKLRAYNLQDLGYDTVMANLMLNHGADERTYEVAQAILKDLGLDRIRLLTNNPDKIEQIEKERDIKVVERVPMMPKSWEAIETGMDMDTEFVVREGAVEDKVVRGKELDKYLRVKVERMRHMIPIPTAMGL
ncbi:GTP cyclohydrolase II [Lunasporangiospora selenospora]|uniref:GTP cyclohydrolase II n=1 Tax=Lunasporangiospora selenospora TaxID=979761 RepID=A0A9P6FNN1_9FUNG|nr:GTP cyclohydrolase II [Lunasporangiospora selenospora]